MTAQDEGFARAHHLLDQLMAELYPEPSAASRRMAELEAREVIGEPKVLAAVEATAKQAPQRPTAPMPRAREPEAEFTEFFAVTYQMALSSAVVAVKDRDLAQDVAQLAYLQLWDRWDDRRVHDFEANRGFLRQLVRVVAVGQLRRRARTVTLDEVVDVA